MATRATIEVDRQTAAALTAQARAKGLSLDAYLQGLAGLSSDVPSNGELTLAEFDHCLDELHADLPELPLLPSGFSRADVYGDHD